MKKQNITFIWVGVGVLGILAFFFRNAFSSISINFLLLVDNMLEFSKSLNPILMWIILGLFVGLVYGTLTACKKYNLDFKLNFIFIGMFIVFITLVSFINHPLDPKGISFTPVEPLEPICNNPKTATITQNTNVFTCPQSDCNVLFTSVTKGNKVEILETRSDNWCRVKYKEKIGFMMKNYLSLFSAKSSLHIKTSIPINSKNNSQTSDSSNSVNQSDNNSNNTTKTDTVKN